MAIGIDFVLVACTVLKSLPYYIPDLDHFLGDRLHYLPQPKSHVYLIQRNSSRQENKTEKEGNVAVVRTKTIVAYPSVAPPLTKQSKFQSNLTELQNYHPKTDRTFWVFGKPRGPLNPKIWTSGNP